MINLFGGKPAFLAAISGLQYTLWQETAEVDFSHGGAKVRRKGKFMTENEIGAIIVDCAVKLHQSLGPGLLETVYESVLARQLEQAGLTVQRQVPVPIIFADLTFDEGFRADLVVQEKIIIELKSLEKVHPVHKKQLLTYLKLTGLKLGYLLNFGEELMKHGITRTINGTL